MTCKDCIHFGVCWKQQELLDEREFGEEQECCEEASRFIVPPCKVGDTVYYLTTVDTEKELNATDIFCGTVQSVGFDGKNIWLSVKYKNGLYYAHTAKDFGKTVFLTKEDAEKALKERSGGK